MKGRLRAEHYFKFGIYLVVVVLINIAGMTLFARFDLTENNIYSLSEVSKQTVATLSEPLTINVFFTENLPAPHNSTQRYLRDLLEEYAVYANRNFNYRFYDVSPKEEGISEAAEENRKLAESYGIQPVQIRTIEQDEMKFKNAYMGLVIIHGDLIEKIPAITSTDGLEYQLTTSFEKLNNKISTLAGLREKIQVKLIMSDTLNEVAPYIGVADLAKLPAAVEETVSELNRKNYNQLSYEYVDPEAKGVNLAELQQQYNIMTLKWPELPEEGISAGEGGIGLVVSYADENRGVRLMNVYRIPLLGTQYKLIDMNTLSEAINENIETLIGINEDLGYLADHGTLDASGPMPMNRGQQQEEPLRNFPSLVSETYTLKQVNLKEEPVPDALNCLVIAQPTEEFTDYELYQIDQALMRGTSLAVFSDAFKEVPNPNQPRGFNMGPSYEPLDTGLQKLLAHYGVTIGEAYVMDENCYKQSMSTRPGGGEQPIYFAPIIKNENINHEPDFMKNIKGLITINNSPVRIDADTIKENGLTAQALFSSSSRSWLMRDRINLNPMFIQPPQAEEEFESQELAYLVEGRFPSYFAGKDIPTREADEADIDEGGASPVDMGTDKPSAAEAGSGEKSEIEPPRVEAENEFIAAGQPAKLMVVGSSALLRDNMMDAQGQTPNAVFVLNAIDALNGRGGIAAMRSKTQQFNPLDETAAGTKGLVKLGNIAGLPFLVVAFGLVVWGRRRAKRKRIRMMFAA